MEMVMSVSAASPDSDRRLGHQSSLLTTCSPTLAQHLSHLLLHAEALTLASPLLTDAVAVQLTAHCQYLRVLRVLRPSFTADAIVSLLTSAPSLSEVPPSSTHTHTRTC